MNPLDLVLAVLAGSVTIGGPCVLPLLPVVLGSGIASRHPWRPVVMVGGFVLSFAVMAGMLAGFGSVMGLSASKWRLAAAILIIVFGAVMVLPGLQTRLLAKLEPLAARFQPKRAVSGKDLKSGFLLGLTLGIVWTPCAGPALAVILTLIASQQAWLEGSLLLAAFSVGAGLPMLAVAYGGRLAATRVRRLVPYTAAIQKAFGLLVIVAGVSMIAGWDQQLHVWTLQHMPGGPGQALMCSG